MADRGRYPTKKVPGTALTLGTLPRIRHPSPVAMGEGLGMRAGVGNHDTCFCQYLPFSACANGRGPFGRRWAFSAATSDSSAATESLVRRFSAEAIRVGGGYGDFG